MDAELLRGIERLFIVMGAVAFAYLGYRLYIFGLKEGRANLKVESKLASFVFSGLGPGLFFMAFGGIVLVIAMLSPINEATTTTREYSYDPQEENTTSGRILRENEVKIRGDVKVINAGIKNDMKSMGIQRMSGIGIQGTSGGVEMKIKGVEDTGTAIGAKSGNLVYQQFRVGTEEVSRYDSTEQQKGVLTKNPQE